MQQTTPTKRKRVSKKTQVMSRKHMLREASILFLFLLGVAVVVLIIGVHKQTPSHNRVWQEQLSRLPYIEFFDQFILVHDVRDWRYSADGPTEKRWINRTIKPQDVTRVWLLIEPFAKWNGVAHTMFVFDIRDDDPIVVSVEARMEADETYKASLGFFNQYELSYLWGTEQDMLARRAVLQKNDLYMYPIATTEAYAQHLFAEMMRATNDLHEHPRFYNTLTENCTNVLADSVEYVDPTAMSWHVARILPGYSEEFLYDMGYIQATGTLPEIRNAFFVTDIIASIDIANYDAFSTILREQLRQ